MCLTHKISDDKVGAGDEFSVPFFDGLEKDDCDGEEVDQGQGEETDVDPITQSQSVEDRDAQNVAGGAHDIQQRNEADRVDSHDPELHLHPK